MDQMEPIPMEDTQNVIDFDDVNPNHFDAVLIAGGKKFHVLKGYLAKHSTSFDSLFFDGNANLKEFLLEDVDPLTFQQFLEQLHGEHVLTDTNVEDVLVLALKFNVPAVIRQCTRFLIGESKMSATRRFELGMQYNLEDLMANIIMNTQKLSDLLTLVPNGPAQLPLPTLQHYLQRCEEFTPKEPPATIAQKVHQLQQLQYNLLQAATLAQSQEKNHVQGYADDESLDEESQMERIKQLIERALQLVPSYQTRPAEVKTEDNRQKHLEQLSEALTCNGASPAAALAMMTQAAQAMYLGDSH